MEEAHSSRAAGRRTVGLLLVVLGVAQILFAQPAVPEETAPSDVRLQVLQPRPSDGQLYSAAGVDDVTLEVGWDALQPSASTWNSTYADEQVEALDHYTDAGLGVVLDLGLQYPPRWAFDASPSSRFVDQDGRVWRGGTGEDPLNAVWDPTARQLEADYVADLASWLEGRPLSAIRIGGLLYGEIRLPDPTAAGSDNSLWAFDSAALAASPVPGWVPGSGSREEAAVWLDWYLTSVSDYTRWLAETVAEAFPDTRLDVLMPGWGLRPGQFDTAVDALMRDGTLGVAAAEVGPAVDWRRQAVGLADTGLPVNLVTTWLDAPGYGTAPRDVPPVEWLAGIAAEVGLPLSGENTGGGGEEALSRAVAQAAAYDLETVAWMSARSLVDGPGVTLRQLSGSFGRHSQLTTTVELGVHCTDRGVAVLAGRAINSGPVDVSVQVEATPEMFAPSSVSMIVPAGGQTALGPWESAGTYTVRVNSSLVRQPFVLPRVLCEETALPPGPAYPAHPGRSELPAASAMNSSLPQASSLAAFEDESSGATNSDSHSDSDGLSGASLATPGTLTQPAPESHRESTATPNSSSYENEQATPAGPLTHVNALNRSASIPAALLFLAIGAAVVFSYGGVHRRSATQPSGGDGVP